MPLAHKPPQYRIIPGLRGLVNSTRLEALSGPGLPTCSCIQQASWPPRILELNGCTTVALTVKLTLEGFGTGAGQDEGLFMFTVLPALVPILFAASYAFTVRVW